MLSDEKKQEIKSHIKDCTNIGKTSMVDKTCIAVGLLKQKFIDLLLGRIVTICDKTESQCRLIRNLESPICKACLKEK